MTHPTDRAEAMREAVRLVLAECRERTFCPFCHTDQNGTVVVHAPHCAAFRLATAEMQHARLPLPAAPAASGDGPRAADASRIECVGCDAPSSCRDADGKPLCAACAETCLAPAASAPADDAVARAREEALAVEPDALVNAIMGSDLVRLYGIKSIEVARYHARQITRVYRALAAERAAKGGERG